MKFTIERKKLIKMLENVRLLSPGAKKKDVQVRIYACAAQVFVEAHGQRACENAQVFKEGGCTQPLQLFLKYLKSYENKEEVTIEANKKTLKLFGSTLNVSDYTPDVKPPAHFVGGRVTDTGGAGGEKRHEP